MWNSLVSHRVDQGRASVAAVASLLDSLVALVYETRVLTSGLGVGDELAIPTELLCQCARTATSVIEAIDALVQEPEPDYATVEAYLSAAQEVLGGLRGALVSLPAGLEPLLQAWAEIDDSLATNGRSVGEFGTFYRWEQRVDLVQGCYEVGRYLEQAGFEFASVRAEAVKPAKRQFEAFQRPPEVSFQPVTPNNVLPPPGLPVQDEYAGEDQRDFRGQYGERMATMYCSLPEEQASYTAVLRDGVLCSAASGKPCPAGHMGWVMSLDDSLYVFDPNAVILYRKGLQGQPELVTGGYAAARKALDDDDRTVVRMTHHSTPLAGANVKAAGMVTVDKDGRTTEWDNWSGHVRPGAQHFGAAAETLVAKGLPPSTRMTVKGIPKDSQQGRPVPGLEGFTAMAGKLGDPTYGHDLETRAGIMASLGEHADAHTMHLKKRHLQELSRRRPEPPVTTDAPPKEAKPPGPSPEDRRAALLRRAEKQRKAVTLNRAAHEPAQRKPPAPPPAPEPY